MYTTLNLLCKCWSVEMLEWSEIYYYRIDIILLNIGVPLEKVLAYPSLRTPVIREHY